jgi:LacI family transcriptional regulator
VAGNNAMTIGTLRALKAGGRRVPDDMALVCFDDFEWADLFEPALTAVAQPVRAMAQRAVEMLNSRRSDSSIAVRREVLRPVVAHRTSCGCGGVAPDRPARPGGLHWENTGAGGHAPHEAGEPRSGTSSVSPSMTRSA